MERRKKGERMKRDRRMQTGKRHREEGRCFLCDVTVTLV
jgi:hypothetical protein